MLRLQITRTEFTEIEATLNSLFNPNYMSACCDLDDLGDLQSSIGGIFFYQSHAPKMVQ
jgi:hypothetical protein